MVERPAPARLKLAGRPELRRYSRHLLIPEVGLEGQERLARARVLVIGAGGLGSPVLQYLAAAGVGRIGIVDDDVVDETNLQRQTIFATADIGKSKALVAASFVHALNPNVNVDQLACRFDASNARALVRLYDVIVDCTDRFPTRYLINDACVIERRTNVSASIFRFDGQVTAFVPGGPCYRCLYPEAPAAGTVPTCAEGGVLGVLGGLVGAWQANEVLKAVLSIGEPLIGRLLLVEALEARTREIAFARDPACAVCGDAPSISDAVLNEDLELQLDDGDVEPSDLDRVLETAVLLDVRELHERVLGDVDGAITIPASVLEARLHELDSSRAYVVACRVGVKSLWAARRLRDAGLTKVRHLRGGLLAYAAQSPEFEFF